MQQGKVLIDDDWNELSYHSEKYCGIYRATVTDNVDPLKNMRLKVIVPNISGNLDIWALPCLPVGSSSMPAIGQSIWVMFEEGEPDRPVWIGILKKP